MAAFARDPNGGLNPVDATALHCFDCCQAPNRTSADYRTLGGSSCVLFQLVATKRVPCPLRSQTAASERCRRGSRASSRALGTKRQRQRSALRLAVNSVYQRKLPPSAQAAHDTAKAQHNLCLDWLLYIMTSSSGRTRTKDDLRPL